MKKQGLMDMAKHPADGRVTILSLTEYGVNHFEVCADTEEAFLYEVFQGFDEDTLTGAKYRDNGEAQKWIDRRKRNSGIDGLDYNRLDDTF